MFEFWLTKNMGKGFGFTKHWVEQGSAAYRDVQLLKTCYNLNLGLFSVGCAFGAREVKR